MWFGCGPDMARMWFGGGSDAHPDMLSDVVPGPRQKLRERGFQFEDRLLFFRKAPSTVAAKFDP